jgi:hypothetical protein
MQCNNLNFLQQERREDVKEIMDKEIANQHVTVFIPQNASQGTNHMGAVFVGHKFQIVKPSVLPLLQVQLASRILYIKELNADNLYDQILSRLKYFLVKC